MQIGSLFEIDWGAIKQALCGDMSFDLQAFIKFSNTSPDIKWAHLHSDFCMMAMRSYLTNKIKAGLHHTPYVTKEICHSTFFCFLEFNPGDRGG